MSRKCTFTGKRHNVANLVSHSNIKTKTIQRANLQRRRLWWAAGARFVTLKLSTQALRTIDLKGLENYAAECGVKLENY